MSETGVYRCLLTHRLTLKDEHCMRHTRASDASTHAACALHYAPSRAQAHGCNCDTFGRRSSDAGVLIQQPDTQSQKSSGLGDAGRAAVALGGTGAFVAGVALLTQNLLAAESSGSAGLTRGSGCFSGKLARLRQELRRLQGSSLSLHYERDITRDLLYTRLGISP